MKKFIYTISVLFLLFSCDDISSSSVIGTDNLQMKIKVESEEVTHIEEFKGQFELKNISDKEIAFRFSSGCQYGYTISQNNNILFDSRENLDCSAVLTKLSLKPNQTKSFPISFDKFNINDTLGKGEYTLNAFLLENHSRKTSTAFKVK